MWNREKDPLLGGLELMLAEVSVYSMPGLESERLSRASIAPFAKGIRTCVQVKHLPNRCCRESRASIAPLDSLAGQMADGS